MSTVLPSPLRQRVRTARRRFLRARRSAVARLTGGVPASFPLREVYGIAVASVQDPFAATWPAEPVLDQAALREASGFYPADPFLVERDGRLWLLFELLRFTDGKGVIAAASAPGPTGPWQQHGVVLEEPHHLSYPHPIEDDGELYLLPEAAASGTTTLYRCDRMPDGWTPVGELLPGRRVDATPFRWEGRWWLLSCPAPDTHDVLELHSAPALSGPWTPHPASPVVTGDPTAARPAGAVVVTDEGPVRLAQVCRPVYGTAVRAFRITELTADRYAETPLAGGEPVLGPTGHGWNADGMHHLHALARADGSWLTATDGWRRLPKW